MSKSAETDLYPPIKSLLESQGYIVKAEIGAADVMAVRGDEPPLIIELKLGFSLALVHQCIVRQRLVEDVYMAVPHGGTKRFGKTIKDNVALARRLGLGVMTVRLRDGHVQIHCDPAPFVPRKSKPRQGRLLREFARRVGDPNDGGQTRRGLVTTYRQDAYKIAHFLLGAGPSKGAHVAQNADVPNATRMMADDHYGWFERISTGIYGLTPKGIEAAQHSGIAPQKQ